MVIKLNKTAFNYARELISQRKLVADQRDDWSERQPSAQQENEFIRRHGFSEHGKWHLGVDALGPSVAQKIVGSAVSAVTGLSMSSPCLTG
jgi:hypothetical protein